MAHIKKIKRKKGNVFKVEVRRKGYQYASKTFRKLSEARAWAKHTEGTLELMADNEVNSSNGDRISLLENEIGRLRKEIQRINRRFSEKG